MKKALSFLLSLIMAFSAFSVMPFSAFALDSSGQCGDDVYWSFDSASGALTLSGTGDTWDYTYDSYADPICDSPFYKNRDIKNIIVESGVTGLGDYLFAGCFDVESISLPEGLTKIGEYALAFFSKIESVTLPSSVRHIGAYAFSNWQKLKSITIPDGVTSIEPSAFLQCYGLKYVFIPKSVTSVGDRAFSNCDSLTDVYYAGSEADRSNMTISSSGSKWLTDAAWHYNCRSGKCGDNVSYLFDGETLTLSGTGDTWDYTFDINADPQCESPFYVNNAIKTINVESGITGLGNNLFSLCYNVESVSLPEGLTKIGEAAFSFFKKIDSITIPSSVTSIGAGAFANWQKLKSITIPDGVTSIESNAFFQCYDLESVVIPKSVMSIGDNAFENCSSLTDVYYYGSEAERSNMTISSTNNSRFTDATWHYNCRSGKCGDNVFYLFDGETLTLSGTGDMWDYDNSSNLSPLYGLEGVDKLIVSKGITGIGKFAFYNTSAKLAVLPDTVTTVTEGAFYNSQYLATVVTDQNLDIVEYRAFYGCNSLSDIYVQGNNNLTGPDVDNSDDANDPFINAAVNFIVAGKYGDDIIILSNEAGGDDSEVVTVMVSGDKRGEKLRLTVSSGEFDGDADITGYNSVLDYSSAVQDAGHLTPGEHAVTALYKDSNNKEYSVSGLIAFGKWFPHIEVEDVEVLFGEDAIVIMEGEDSMTGEAEFTFGGKTYTVPIKDGIAVITFSGIRIGEYPVTVKYSGDDKYLSETVTAKITVKALNNVTPKTATIVYGNAAPTEVEVSYTDGYGNDIAGLPKKLPCTSSYTQYGNVGEYTISLDADKIEQQGIFDAYEQAGYGFSEFDFTATSVLTVTKAPLTITAKKQEYTYNGSNQGPGDTAYEDAQEIAELITVEGLKGTDAVTSIIVDGQGKNADTYELVPQSATVNGKTEALGNYSITYVNGALKINPKAVTVTVHGDEVYMPYNSTERVYNGKVACAFDPEILTDYDAAKFSYTGSTTVKGTNAGNYETKLSTDKCAYNDSNYKITWVAGSPIRLHVSQSALDITADNKETNHGSDLAELTYTIDNLHSCYYNEDELNISISTNADKNKPGNYDIILSCEDNPNYAVRTFNGTYTVDNSPHTWSDVTYEWTDTSSVTAIRKCVYCDEAESETVATTFNATPATCTEKGRTTYTATFTNSVFETQTKTVFTDALGHKYGEEGEERYTCTVCGAVDKTLKKACAEKDKAEFAASVTATPGDDGATIAWKKAPEAKRYVIYAAYCGKNKYKKIKTVKGNITSFKLTKLSGRKINTRKNLKVYIVAQKKANGKWVKLFKTPTFHIAGKNSKYTNIKKIKVKKAEFTLEQGNTAKIKASLVLENKKKKPINHVKKLRYMSTDTAVVKVTKSGKIKAVGKGRATVYVFSNNGTPKAIKVTVN